MSDIDMVNGSPILETNRLQLRLFEQSDVDQLHRLYSDPEVMRYMQGTRDRKQAEDHILAFAQQYARAGFTLWAVEQKTDGQFVGRVGLMPLDGTQEVELGYVIARRYRLIAICDRTVMSGRICNEKRRLLGNRWRASQCRWTMIPWRARRIQK